VLTAAHCVDGLTANMVIIGAGLFDWQSTNEIGSENVRVQLIYVHPQYNNVTTDNDIALLK
jgi:secreted trypsin-like serine protease